MILQSKFIDRERELRYLLERHSSGRAELIVIYGRRRVGKTYLLQKFIERVGGIYLIAEESENILDDFSEVLAAFFSDAVLADNPLRNWKSFFTYLAEKSKNDRLVVVIDEVQYAAKVHREFLSLLQKYWDTVLSTTKIMLILCGSLISFMEGVMAYESPIYGRRTGAWMVGEMSYADCSKFHDIPVEDVVRLYSIFGGVPQYWSDYDPSKGFWDNIRDLLLVKGAKYYDEPRYLLKMELREISRYFSILRAIACGYTTFGKISDKSRVSTTSLGKYLSVLENLGYVEIEYPLGGRRRGVYRIKDNLFNFWFRYVYPHRSEIEMNVDIVPKIKTDFEGYVGERFEKMVTEFLMGLNAESKLPEVYQEFGRWWHRGEEIDVVAVGEKSVLVGDAKWRNLTKRDVVKILRDLEEKAKKLPLRRENVFRCIVARKIEDKDVGTEGVLLFDLDDMFRLEGK